jgi:hypothetical protein
MGARQRMQRATFERSGMVFISGLPAGAERPRTSFTLRFFTFSAKISKGFPPRGIGLTKKSRVQGSAEKRSGEEGRCQALVVARK